MRTESQVTLALGVLQVSLAGRPRVPLFLLQLRPGDCEEEVGWSDLSCLICATRVQRLGVHDVWRWGSD